MSKTEMAGINVYDFRLSFFQEKKKKECRCKEIGQTSRHPGPDSPKITNVGKNKQRVQYDVGNAAQGNTDSGYPGVSL